MDKDFANYLLVKTKDDYNRIAHHFSMTRGYLPEDLKEMRQYAEDEEKILDLGCGNGRLCELFSAEQYVGADVSEKLIGIAKEKYPKYHFEAVDFLKLPYKDKTFDIVFCLAVLHHIPSGEYRGDFLRECWRILKDGGKIVLTVWDLQKEKELKQLDYDLSKYDDSDVLYPFKDGKGNILADRYIHCFSEMEFRELVEKNGFKILEEKIQGRGRYQNLFILAQKGE